MGNLTMNDSESTGMKLSDTAENALQSECPVLVLGGPGSGKTTLSLLKAKSYVSELAPEQAILFLSFSRAAVRQVEIRCRDLLNAEEQRSIEVRIYHSFALDVLKTHGRLLTGTPPRILYPSEETLLKSRHSGLWEKEAKRLAVEEGRYVFGEFASAANKLLVGSKAVAKLIADKYPVVILDEFQDTNDSQWELVKTLSLRSRMVFLADPDQRIFDYDKHVSAERLQHLRDDLRPAEFDLGGDNHRSPNSGILAYANAVLHNKALPAVPEIQTLCHNSNNFGEIVHLAVLATLSELQEKGIERPSVAVLARTNAMVAKTSDCLSQDHEFRSRPMKPIVHDVLWDAGLTTAAALVVASILEWTALPKVTALAQTFELIAEYFDMKNASNSKGVKYAQESSKKFSNEAKSLKAGSEPSYKVTKHFGKAYDSGLQFAGRPADDWLKARDLLDITTDNLDRVLGDVKFVRLFRATDQIGGCLSDLWDRHGNYINASDLLRRPLSMQSLQSDYREPAGCSLMTVHKAKGKEFDGVVIVDGNPKKADAFFREKASSSKRESARRLLRVAITRARHRVLLVRPYGALPLTDE
jgi:Superfamily I DNA and RNA helicases